MEKLILFFPTYWVLVLISDAAAVIVSAVLADKKGRSIGGWICGGLFLGWISVIILLLLSDLSVKMVHRTKHTNEFENANYISYTNMHSKIENEDVDHKWRCDKCGNMISEDPCPFCKKSFSSSFNQKE